MVVFGRRALPSSIGLLSEDKEWLVHHTECDEPELDGLCKLFKKDYPRGGMFRAGKGALCRETMP